MRTAVPRGPPPRTLEASSGVRLEMQERPHLRKSSMSANASTDAALDTGAKTDLAALRITQRGAKFARYGGGAEGIVVFIHGYLDSPAEWREVLQNLCRPGGGMVAVEIRFGGGLRPAATLEAYSRQVR